MCGSGEPAFRKNFKSLKADKEKYEELRTAFWELYDTCPTFPIMLRYAWHDAGTYNKKNKTGGPNGSIRFEPEHNHDANAGLAIARSAINDMKVKFPAISYADLIQIGGYVAVEYAGGPAMPFRFGRQDAEEADCTENGRLPDAKQGVDHLRFIFNRMGFNDQEITTLSGAHCLGGAHQDRSGFEGKWTADPKKFDNSYFCELLNQSDEELLQLPTDQALLTVDSFKTWVEKFAEDQDMFFRVYSATHVKLSELGWSEK